MQSWESVSVKILTCFSKFHKDDPWARHWKENIHLRTFLQDCIPASGIQCIHFMKSGIFLFWKRVWKHGHVREINSLKQLFWENRRRRVTAARYSKHNISFGCTASWAGWWISACTEHWLFLTNLRKKSQVCKEAFPFCFWKVVNLIFTVDVLITEKEICSC